MAQKCILSGVVGCVTKSSQAFAYAYPCHHAWVLGQIIGTFFPLYLGPPLLRPCYLKGLSVTLSCIQASVTQTINSKVPTK